MFVSSPSSPQSHDNPRPVPQGQAGLYAPFLDFAFRNYSGPSFVIRFWDNSVWFAGTHDGAFEIYLGTEDAWATLSAAPDENSLRGKYATGEIGIDGDLYAALRSLPLIEQTLQSGLPCPAISVGQFTAYFLENVSKVLRWGSAHSKPRNAASIAQKFDQAPDFYELFLGPSMVYSCAYFRDWKNDLERAQYDKLEMICRKLDLKPHDRFLDIGCSWGSLVLYACEKYGVSGHGVSLSLEQVEFAQRRVARSNAASRCSIYLKNFRDLNHVRAPFDKIASVGMSEYIGFKHIGAYFDQAYKLLVPGGIFLHHAVTRSIKSRSSGPSFAKRFISPDVELLTLSELIVAAEEAGFEVQDVEDLREHHEETLHRWVQALSEHEKQARVLVSKSTFLAWKLYMAGYAEAFKSGDTVVHQLLLSKNSEGRSSATKIREVWYLQPRAIND